MLRVVINADDLGMSPAVNDAVFAALDAGWCTSASLLATGPAAEDALRRARLGGHAVGVHLDLTGFRPLTGRPARLLGADFRRDARAIGPDHADDVLAEWTAQVERVRDAGVTVDHLDSHQHVHHLPALRGTLRRLCDRVGITRVRGMGALRARGAGTRIGALLQPLRAARFRAGLRADGLVTTDGFASVAVFLARVRSGWRPGWGSVELMAHPGNPHHAVYADELAALAAGALDTLPFPVRRVRWSNLG